MRKAFASLTAALSLGSIAVTPALAHVSTTQTLPAQACNQGTMNAHNHIPETTGTGTTTPGHMAVPGTAYVHPLRPRRLTEKRPASRSDGRRALRRRHGNLRFASRRGRKRALRSAVGTARRLVQKFQKVEAQSRTARARGQPRIPRPQNAKEGHAGRDAPDGGDVHERDV
jgi:hypothetical protein